MKISDSDLRDVLLNSKLNSRGQYICDCPFCGKEKHFYISRETQLWDCKHCNEYGNAWKLLNFLNKLYLLQGQTVEFKDNIQSIKSQRESLQLEEEVLIKDLPVVKLPVGWKLFKENDYLKNRGITNKDILRYNFGFTTLFKKYENYVIVPIYDSKKIRGFIARYGEKKVPKDKLRYNNSVGTDFSMLLFGYDEITENTKTVILVEGIFDKIAVDKALRLWGSEEIKCCCTFGHKISDGQIKKLQVKKILNVVLLFDFDAIKEIKKYSFELEKYFFTNIVYTEYKDIDETPEDKILQVFNNIYTPRDFYNSVIGKIRKK